ncbi:MAG: hypothetical protein LM590_06595 [Thermofilum sp.]|jgi:hypothetical protein|nr:hypothetical protein [Thermofilum sp.]
MSEEVGRSLMLIITLSVVALIGFFMYSVASSATNRPILVQAGDALITGSQPPYTLIIYLQNIGTSTIDLAGAMINIPDLGVSSALSCDPQTLKQGDITKCTVQINVQTPITSAKTAVIETRYGAVKITLLRA